MAEDLTYEERLDIARDIITRTITDLIGTDENAATGEWVLGYSFMASNPHSADGISYRYGYTVSDGSPHAIVGLADFTAQQISADCTPGDD